MYGEGLMISNEQKKKKKKIVMQYMDDRQEPSPTIQVGVM